MTFQKKNVIIVFKASNSGLLTLTSFYRTGVKEMATQRGRKTASGRKRTNNRKRNTRRKQDSFSTEVKDEVILLLGIAVTILLFLSNFHLIGKAGDAVSARYVRRFWNPCLYHTARSVSGHFIPDSESWQPCGDDQAAGRNFPVSGS